ncbi:MAG: LysR family transcriptional regulator [Xanthomonas sp.]
MDRLLPETGENRRAGSVDFDSVRLFLRVVEQGSLTAAARQARVPLTSVSRRIKALEQALGVQLLHRTTRRLAVSEAGRAFYARCVEAEQTIQDAVQAARDLRAQARGTLRVLAPYALGLLVLEPQLARFRQRHPGVQLALTYDDQPLDLLSHGLDVAIHVGPTAHSSYVARPLGASRGILVSSPEYLARAGTPTHPRELLGHAVLAVGADAPLVLWALRHSAGESTELTLRPLLISNESTTVIRQVVQGAGIALLSQPLVQSQLDRGQLVRLLPGWQRWPDLEISALYPRRATQERKVRAFVDFLLEVFADWRVSA